jgi:flagellar protein FliT
MGLVDELCICSEKLLNVLKESTVERDQRIANVEQLLAEREILIKRLKDQSFENLRQHPKAHQIVKMEKDIQKRMTTIFESIKEDIKRLNQQKRSHQSYTEPFANVQTYDGRFYDKRK